MDHDSRRAFLQTSALATLGLSLVAGGAGLLGRRWFGGIAEAQAQSDGGQNLDNSYLAIAKRLNPNRSYVFVDVEKLGQENGDGDDFRQAMESEIRTQLTAQGTPVTRELVDDYTKAAESMNKNKFDGDAKIFNQNGREVAMVYWKVPARTSEEFTGVLGGYHGSIDSRFLDAADPEKLRDQVILHEIGHATSPERNARNTSVRYETGANGLYANHRSELRAEIVGTMERMRKDGNPDAAQAFNDLRSLHFFEDVKDLSTDRRRITPEMEYYIFQQAQKVIDDAKFTGRFKFTDAEIAKTADRISLAEDSQLQATRANGDGGLLEREGLRLADISRQAGGSAGVAIKERLLDPQKDKVLIRRLAAAWESVSGEKVLGNDSGAPIEQPPIDRPRPPRPGLPPDNSCDGVDPDALDIARRIGGTVQNPRTGAMCDPSRIPGGK